MLAASAPVETYDFTLTSASVNRPSKNFFLNNFPHLKALRTKTLSSLLKGEKGVKKWDKNESNGSEVLKVTLADAIVDVRTR